MSTPPGPSALAEPATVTAYAGGPPATPASVAAGAPPHPIPTLTVTDVVSLGAAVLLAVVATCSLALAHAHHHTLPGVIAATLAVLVLAGLALRRFGRPVRVVGDRRGLAALGVGCVIAAAMFLPGFSYGVTDRDPGGYVAHGVEIAHHGSYSFIDPVLALRIPVQVASPGARFPGIWVDNPITGRIVPQFYHLWPALIATAFDVGGYGGITALTPIAGILGVLVLIGLVRRLTRSATAAALAGILMATNMLQVWQSKTPSTEVFAELVFLSVLALVVIAVQERWAPAAFAAGVLVDVEFLNRGDAWLLMMISAAGMAALWVLRAFDRRAAAFLAGAVLLAPYAFWQAYYAAADYSELNSVPSQRKTLELLAVLTVLALVTRPALGPVTRRLLPVLAARRWQLLLGGAVCAVVLGGLALGFERPRLFGQDFFHPTPTTVARSYDEQIMRRLSWFITLPGFALAGLGVAVVALRRWTTAAWFAILPGLVLFPIFAYHARISTRLMFWGRRYVSYSLPLVLLLMGIALGFGLIWQWRGRHLLRGPALLAAAGITAMFLVQSLPLRHHDEWHGSFGITQQIADLSGSTPGVYLWQDLTFCCGTPDALFATPVWLERDQLSVLIPADPKAQADYIRLYRRTFAGRPMFVVWNGSDLPPFAKSAGLTVAKHLTGVLPYWEESDVSRPKRNRVEPVTYDFTVYRVA